MKDTMENIMISTMTNTIATITNHMNHCTFKTLTLVSLMRRFTTSLRKSTITVTDMCMIEMLNVLMTTIKIKNRLNHGHGRQRIKSINQNLNMDHVNSQ